ncbi:MAG: endonuclease/exonuclease/phosphatase family protein [Candidatus Cyclobacteriaceae bacterium M3_2C_046]
MSIAIQLIIIFPYTTFSDTELSSVKGKPEVDDVFSILVANVWMKNNNYTALLNIIEKNQPDIVIALEVNAWWLDQIKVLESRYNYVEKKPFDNTYGMALYSKLPLKNTRILYLNHEKVPSIHTQVIMNSNKEFNLHVVHPVPPKPSNHPDNVGEKEIALVKVGNMVVNEKLPSVVAGDFNDVAWSKTSRLFKEEGQLNDIRVGRGIYNTFNAKSWILRWPLDHVYVTSEFKVVEIKRLNKFGSDHFPFWVSLAF